MGVQQIKRAAHDDIWGDDADDGLKAYKTKVDLGLLRI